MYLYLAYKISYNNFLFVKKTLPEVIRITFDKFQENDNVFLFNLVLKEHGDEIVKNKFQIK